MEAAWIETFYQETDAPKRLELLKQNTENELTQADVFRKKLWVARYGKRKPTKDAFFLKFMEVSRDGRGFTSLVFGMGQLSDEGVVKKIAEQISAIAFQAPHALHMDKEFALLQEAALQAFRQEYPNREHFLKK